MSEFNGIKHSETAIRELQQKYHQNMMDAMQGRFETEIGLNDPYWDARHRWQVLYRIIQEYGTNRDDNIA
jgi:hypothetical protein